MVSFIVPVFQAVKTLDECVQSILSQTFSDLELILIDDGSSDGSGMLCDSYKDRRVRVLHRDNQGAAAARNAGIAVAEGDFICFVDSDDVISEEFLSHLTGIADKTGADIVSCAYSKCHRLDISDRTAFFETNRIKEPKISVYKGHEAVKALLYQQGFISAPWGMISKRTLWDEVRFPEGVAAEDMGTIYRLFLAASRTARTEALLYGYVQSASNTIFSTSSRRNPDYFILSRRMVLDIKKQAPDCIKAASSRHLSACFQILSETDPNTCIPQAEKLINKVYRDIKSIRCTVLKDPKARLKNRAAAALSFTGLPLLHRYLYSRYIKGIPKKTESIAMVEYQGRCDENARAVGHVPKVLPEYYAYIADDFDVSVYAPDVILKEASERLTEAYVCTLPYRIVMRGNAPLTERIGNKLNMFKNISYVLKKNHEDVLWFYNVEFYLFLYLALFGNKGNKIAVTLFLDGFHSGALKSIKQKIFEAGQKKVWRCISTGASFNFKNMDSVFIPDYMYDEALYGRYEKNDKGAYAVCLGTMDKGKQLDELINAFNRMSFRLMIAGRFYDEAWYEALRSKASDNIEIRNEYLDTDEYLTLLSKARYVIVPYNEGNYSRQTSGVMQEAVFTGTVIVTHKDILSGNKLPGIGYKDYRDITDGLLEDTSYNKKRDQAVLMEYDRLKRSVYSRDSIQSRIKNSLSE